jgi:hypothetical protein
MTNTYRRLLLGLAAATTLAGVAMAQLPRTAAPAGARVYFIEPSNGASISGPVVVKMGLAGMGVAPAGAQFPNTGHHHLLINAPAYDPAQPLPMTDTIRHFGGGQTETSLALPPGTYQLQLVLGDWLHIPHNPPVVSEVITITVR